MTRSTIRRDASSAVSSTSLEQHLLAQPRHLGALGGQQPLGVLARARELRRAAARSPRPRRRSTAAPPRAPSRAVRGPRSSSPVRSRPGARRRPPRSASVASCSATRRSSARDRLAGGDELDGEPVALRLGRGRVLLDLADQLAERGALAFLIADGGAQLLELAGELVALVADGPQAPPARPRAARGPPSGCRGRAAGRRVPAPAPGLGARPRGPRPLRVPPRARPRAPRRGRSPQRARPPAATRSPPAAPRAPPGVGRACSAVTRLRSSSTWMRRSLSALAALAPTAATRRRQLDDEAAPDLELGAQDVAAIGVPVERRAPGLVGLGDLRAGDALATPAGVDGQRRAPDPAAAHAVPAADDLEPVVRCPLEALELEGDLPDRRHQLCSPASGGSGFSSDVLERATGAPVSVGGGR